ncbi:bax inhibitor 1 [[Candida] jaroonii]|uniref:Bax inhibitor 1 n=1 Tax=[Candida] jaroonii TaxID=467808 RepID=A0ACA9Y6C5_9ASCO|nr:bax inhibitor 1 [[Candida] jaroonii]
MSYTAVPTQPPPYGENPEARTEGDNVPDDFKYSVDVASCELPVRQMFIRKVYSLLTAQILATVVVGFVIRSNTTIQNWCFNNFWLFIVSIVGSFGFLIATHIKARSYPINLVLLGAFTLCESYGIGLSCSLVESEIVIQALMLTLVVFIGLTLFAFQSKYDFRSWQSVASLGLWFLIGWGFLMMFFPQSSFANLIYSGIGAIIFSVYILIDTQEILKTCHLDDEIPATLKLYLDIINLFLFILRILNNRNEN